MFPNSIRATEAWRDSIASEIWASRVPFRASHIFLQSAQGAYLTDVDGNKFIDLSNGSGSVFLGHNNPAVKAAIRKFLLRDECSLSCPSVKTVMLAKQLAADVGLDHQAAFFATGTDAVRAAIEIARRGTGRRIILHCGYHGWESAWRSPNPLRPNSSGVVDFLYVLDLAERFIKANPRSVAALLVSPHPYLLSRHWYRRLRELATEHRVLLISDEVKQGYRHATGPSMRLFGVEADLYTFSKVIANGFRLSAVVGHERLMSHGRNFIHTSYLDALCVTAALATLKVYRSACAAERVRANGDHLIAALSTRFGLSELPIAVTGVGSLFHFAFGSEQLETAFYARCTQAGLLFSEDGSQTPSLAFGEDVLGDALHRLGVALTFLAADFKDLQSEPLTLTRKLHSDGRQLHGIPESAHARFAASCK